MRVVTRDDGRAPARDGLGHGLIGMRERVALYGGSLRAGPHDAGGFEVESWLPVPPEATAQ